MHREVETQTQSQSQPLFLFKLTRVLLEPARFIEHPSRSTHYAQLSDALAMIDRLEPMIQKSIQDTVLGRFK